MQINTIYYDNEWQRVWDTHGKQYTIKQHQGWKFINVGNTKIGINKLPHRLQIKDFDDVVANYIFGWHTQYPCPAIGYFVYRKVTNKNITLKQYYNLIKATQN